MTLPASPQCEPRREIPATHGFPAAGNPLDAEDWQPSITAAHQGCRMISTALVSGFSMLLVKYTS
jgi:hypothetical protein